MITHITNELPIIEWEKGDLIERLDEHTAIYCASGESEDERLFIGDMVIIDDECIEIENITEV